MRLFVFLLFMSMAHLICARFNEVQLQLKVLKPDLQVIAMYYEKGDLKTANAFIDWPNDTSFLVQKFQFEDEVYLKIVGSFKEKGSKSPYDGLYFKDDKFYYQNTDEMKPLKDSVEVEYDNQSMTKGESYMSIRYRSLAEVESAIAPFINKHSSYVESCTKESRATYLATWNGPPRQFLEYTMWNDDKPMQGADEGIRALVAEVKDNKVSVKETEYFKRVVFDQKTGEVRVHSSDIELRFTGSSKVAREKLFGIRMDEVGILAEVRGQEVKLLNTLQLRQTDSTFSPYEHLVCASTLLARSRRAEPQASDNENRAHADCLRDRPKEGKFQVQGHILIKTANYMQDGSVDTECPFSIKNESEKAYFMLVNRRLNEICTNDHELWERFDREHPFDSVAIFGIEEL